jgi:hypothetical protein
MLVSEFDYHLPEELIAQQPATPRDSSRLMVVNRRDGSIRHDIFRNLLKYLRQDDTVVFNQTKVIPARIRYMKSSGGRQEIFLLRQTSEWEWEALCKPGLRVGEKTMVGAVVAVDEEDMKLALETLKDEETFAMIHANFSLAGELDLPQFDVIFADLGLSSPHLDDPSRGFSFRFEGPLDLRLDRSKGLNAADLLSSATEEELFRIFADLGELSGSSKLARHLVQQRDAGTVIKSTTELKNEYFKTDEYKELEARRVLGRAAPGETVYIIPKSLALSKVKIPESSAKVEEAAPQTEVKKSRTQANFESWMDFFFGRQNSL